jgi:hypothetical protein
MNPDNVVSFDIDGSDIVRVWYVGSTTPIILKPPIPASALLEFSRTGSGCSEPDQLFKPGTEHIFSQAKGQRFESSRVYQSSGNAD